MCNLGTLFVGLNSRNEVLSHNARMKYGASRGLEVEDCYFLVEKY